MSRIARCATTFAVTALLTAGAVALPAAATAAEPKFTCNLLIDAQGDTSPVQSPHLDIRSGDIASGPLTVVGVLRLRSLRTTDTYAATGARWDLSFTVKGAQYVFSLRRDATGAATATFTRAYGLGDPVAVATPAWAFEHDSIRWTVPRALVSELPAIPAGDGIHGLSAQTFGTPADVEADVALTSASYADGTASCLRAS